jgi:hypothetical protein
LIAFFFVLVAAALGFAGFFAASFFLAGVAFVFFAGFVFAVDPDEGACFIKAANLVKNCSANDRAVLLIKRDPSIASLPPICASTSYSIRVSTDPFSSPRV